WSSAIALSPRDSPPVPTPPRAAPATARHDASAPSRSQALAKARAGCAPRSRSRHALLGSSAPAASAGTDGSPPPNSAGPAGLLPRHVPASAPPGDSRARRRCTAETRGWLPERPAPVAVAIAAPGPLVGVGTPGPHAGTLPDRRLATAPHPPLSPA